MLVFLNNALLSPRELGDQIYQPTLGQVGKDVIWLPTPDAPVVRMLSATEVTKDDLVYDLGAGDGKIPIAAAKQFRAHAVGIEYNSDMAELARRNVARAGVESMVKIITCDIFVEDFSKATVITISAAGAQSEAAADEPQVEARHARHVASIPHGRL